MITAIVFVLFVLDKYTINTLSDLKVESILVFTSFICDEEQPKIKRKDVKSICAIGIVIYHSYYKGLRRFIFTGIAANAAVYNIVISF